MLLHLVWGLGLNFCDNITFYVGSKALNGHFGGRTLGVNGLVPLRQMEELLS